MSMKPDVFQRVKGLNAKHLIASGTSTGQLTSSTMYRLTLLVQLCLLRMGYSRPEAYGPIIPVPPGPASSHKSNTCVRFIAPLQIGGMTPKTSLPGTCELAIVISQCRGVIIEVRSELYLSIL